LARLERPKKLRELRLETAKLASEAAELRAQLAIERSRPVDLPSPLSRRVN